MLMSRADIRINSQDNSLSLTYFGVITQTTDEDWNDVRVVRSCFASSALKSPFIRYCAGQLRPCVFLCFVD